MSCSSSAPSRTSDSEPIRSGSVGSAGTNDTSASEFLAAVATEPPREEDYRGYPTQETTWPLPGPRRIREPTDDLPSPEKLAEAAKVPVLDAEGNRMNFENLYIPSNSVSERRLILFIRHWYCQACQSYVKCLQDLIPSSHSNGKQNTSEPPTNIILVGCGHPSLIRSYIRRTHCPYPIYTEPSLKLLKLLGCHRWGGVLWGFSKRPEYASELCAGQISFNSLYDKYRSVYRDTLSGDSSSETSDFTHSSSSSESAVESGLTKRPSRQGLQSGPIFQVGGEFLFEQGRLVWCHRMKGMRSHAEIKTLRRVLDMEDEEDTIEARLESKWVEQELRELEAQGKRPSKELRHKVEKLSKACDTDDATRAALTQPPISDEDEERYLERRLGRKPSLPSVKNGFRVVKEPDSPRAYLTRDAQPPERSPRLADEELQRLTRRLEETVV